VLGGAFRNHRGDRLGGRRSIISWLHSATIEFSDLTSSLRMSADGAGP
jgi:hypothetical protein